VAVLLLVAAAGCRLPDDATRAAPADTAGDQGTAATPPTAVREGVPASDLPVPASACGLQPDALSGLDTLRAEGGGDDPVRMILVIADGAGAGYWTAARMVRDSLSVMEMPVMGYTDSRNAEGRITDSAAAGTALATGCLTYNKAIGMAMDTTPRATLLEVAERRGLSTGLVTTSRVTHATPSVFATHVVDRWSEEEIAAGYAESDVDVLMGGGRQYFRAADREDGRDLVPALRERGAYVETPGELRALSPDTLAGLVGLFADDDLPPAPERDVSLPEMTRRALEVLDRDPDGFFLMVEAAQPDWRGHDAGSLEAVQAEMLDLDDAVREAMRYRQDRPETQLLVLADHETGGLAVGSAEGGPMAAYWATADSDTVGDHTANLVPHFAVGPGTDRFRGLHTVAWTGRRLLETVGGPELPAPFRDEVR
jgi:alkaline phosphatase